MLRFYRAYSYLTIVFTSTLADALRSMDVSHYPDSLTPYPRITRHRLMYSYVPFPFYVILLTRTIMN